MRFPCVVPDTVRFENFAMHFEPRHVQGLHAGHAGRGAGAVSVAMKSVKAKAWALAADVVAEEARWRSIHDNDAQAVATHLIACVVPSLRRRAAIIERNRRKVP